MVQPTRQMFLLFLLPILAGALIGMFFLFPVNEFVFYFEHSPDAPSAWAFTSDQIWNALGGGHPLKTLFYAVIGGFLGLVAAVFFSSIYKRTAQIKQLSAELEKDLLVLIAHGESAHLEFKSSFRWDIKQEKVNRGLEDAIMKTLAGFMNGGGGTLIIGVDDDGNVLGLDNDYTTLKKKDRDGFEQAIMNAVSVRIGTDACQYLQVVFHAIEGKDVCRIITARSHKPVYVIEAQSMKFYLRTGVSTRELNVQEAVDFISNRWG